MTHASHEVWGLITARGGSKTIPLKNMVSLEGRPLIDYVVRAGRAAPSLTRLVCSTESAAIAAHCRASGVEVHDRPAALAEDNVATVDVLVDCLETLGRGERALPEAIALLEPTSPFLLPSHIESCIALLRERPDAESAQTIAAVAPNSHAYNQRVLRDGAVSFVFAEERRRHYNKQLKPGFYVHGNVRVVRTRCLLEKHDIFGSVSLPVVIPRLYAMDVDGPEDLETAQCLLRCGAVRLP
jgi:CMP-N,N'-diacetyllegionaminic acid synthase